jgi:glycerophosphoryl diester phosphodiesterase
MSHPFLEHQGPIPFAHRGGASQAPENTMAAFEDAVRLGYQYLETDVHTTADGKLVAFHDNDLQRMCNIHSHINEMTWSDLQHVRVDGVEPIPLLEELLTAFPNAKINIDCKSNSSVNPLIQILKVHNCLDRVCIGSFSDRRLATLRSEFGSALCTSLGPRQVARLLVASRTRTRLANRLRGLVAQIPVRQFGLHLTSSKMIKAANELGIPIHVWTIDSVDEMNQLLDEGIDGIMTDNTRLLKEVFLKRDLWRE